MILDQFGRPIHGILQLPCPALELPEMSKPASEWEAVRRVEQLRQSCGIAPKTIVFRRSNPYVTKA